MLVSLCVGTEKWLTGVTSLEKALHPLEILPWATLGIRGPHVATARSLLRATARSALGEREALKRGQSTDREAEGRVQATLKIQRCSWNV